MNLFQILKFNKILCNNQHILILKNAVRNNFANIDMARDILNQYPFLKEDISSRIKSNHLFQPGRITETVICQSISNTLGCRYIENGVYENNSYKIIQDGGSGKFDLKIIEKNNQKEYIFEIKEPIAYGKSCGFTYNDNGFPVEFTSKDEKFKDYVKTLFEEGNLLENYNILDCVGHNKVYDIDNILTSNFDYIISYNGVGELIIMTSDEYRNNFNFKIEVRSCGRNTRKVFTKNKLNIQNNLVTLDEKSLQDIIQRGGKLSSRLKIIINKATFSFKKKDLIKKNSNVFVSLCKIKQHVGEVSIQHFRRN